MVFRKENKADAFQRQISALRQQLGTEGESEDQEAAAPSLEPPSEDDPTPAIREERGGFGTRDATGYSFATSEYGGASSTAYAPETEAPTVPALPQAGTDADTSVIAHDATWKGDFLTDGTVHVHGRFEGSIVAKHDVYVAEEADVDATVAAENVIIAGLVKGSIRCDVRFEVLPQGRIVGDIQSPTLVIHEGARITGQFRMGAPEVVTADKAPSAVVQRRAVRGG